MELPQRIHCAQGSKQFGFRRICQWYAAKTLAEPLLNLVSKVVGVESYGLYPCRNQGLEGIVENGFAAHWQQRFRYIFRQRPQAHPSAGGKDDRAQAPTLQGKTMSAAAVGLSRR